MAVDEGSDQKSDIQPYWMAAHARLKKEFTEDEKYHNLIFLLHGRCGSSSPQYIKVGMKLFFWWEVKHFTPSCKEVSS